MMRFAPLNLSADEIIALTPLWTGPRHTDGRPRASDEVVARLALVSISDAWAVLNDNGFRQQYEGNWQRIHGGLTLCGRALTAMFMPRRRDLNDIIAQRAADAGQVGEFTSWPIYGLQAGDVYVADAFGRIEWGPVVGDNLATAIHARTGCGMVANGAVRDVEGIERIDAFPSFVRGVHPTHALSSAVLVGINCPVRIGAVTVVPGDIILGQGDGLLVIPPHLGELVATRCEIIAIRDRFAKQRLREMTYLPGQIDRRWTAEIEADFRAWLENYPEKLPFPPQTFLD